MTIIIEKQEHVGSSFDLGCYADLMNFMKEWDKSYEQIMSQIPIFNKDLTSQWNREQQQFFVRVLYHLRGHFHEFLWQMGNYAPTAEAKELIIGNIRDEFGSHGLSHEHLYMLFAESLGVDLNYEMLDQNYYAPFAKDYIRAQMVWLREHDWPHRLAAFAAIERLDNVDYVKLRGIAESFGITGKGLTFFNVHICVEHFQAILESSEFMTIWN